jgi:hypothetical protein
MTDCESHSHSVVAAIGQPTIPPKYRAVDLCADDGISDARGVADPHGVNHGLLVHVMRPRSVRAEGDA